MEINPFELDPYDAREKFADFLDEIQRTFLSQMYDIHDDISYILICHTHPFDFSDIDNELLSYLKVRGLNIKPIESKKENKANPDYYLAMYWGIETAENFFSTLKKMDFDSQLNNLIYAKKQLAVMEALLPNGKPKHKIKSNKGQIRGADITNNNKYLYTKNRALNEWNIYKQELIGWEFYKINHLQYETKISHLLKEFEIYFLNNLSKLAWKKKKTEDEEQVVREKYTDSMTKPPLAIGWILELEGLPDRKKEKVKQKKEDDRDSLYSHFKIRNKIDKS